ncbi:RICIN domain-containing protein [Amycolatopsis solani]|uniref:RICIN domain-containing protein n=1 Tax=Amycolatopsis solani TaxID=3028615 RepID=UPI00296E4C65|nr:hypothetical protein [Amycolatopsis sp. MEP2-6]
MEERATANGDVLARSTVADLLRRPTLPRPELLAAYVRACGDEDRLPEWMGTYERLVREATDTAAPEVPPAAPRAGGRAKLAAAAATVLVVSAVVVLVLTLTGDPATPGAGSEPTPKPLPDILAMSSAGTWSRIRPARTPELCLTEGRDRSGRYTSAIAAQLPCAEPGGPRTFLQPVGDDLTQIKWEHPVDKGMGCLTIRTESPAKDMLEPEEDCRIHDEAQLFRIERFGDGYRVRRAHTDRCVGIHNDDTARGAEAVEQPCGDVAAQRFLVDLDV